MLAEPAHHKQRNEDESLVELAPEEQLLEAFLEANGTLTSVTVLGVQGDLERMGILREPTERSKEEVCLFLTQICIPGRVRCGTEAITYACYVLCLRHACQGRRACAGWLWAAWVVVGVVVCVKGGRSSQFCSARMLHPGSQIARDLAQALVSSRNRSSSWTRFQVGRQMREGLRAAVVSEVLQVVAHSGAK